MRSLSHFIGIHLLPLALIVTDKIPASSPTVDAGILCAGRRDTLVAQGARRHQKASARSGDHLVRRRQVLQYMVDDRPYAFGDRLILQLNAVNSAVNCAVLLSDAVNLPVIGRIRIEPPTAKPVRRVG